MSERPKITIYTDGACSGNPGPGGYGVVLLDASGRRKELSAGYVKTTNNRMELRAVIAGLAALKVAADVTVYSDSQYVVKAITEGWLVNWQARGWKKKDKSAVLNIDLWKELLPLLSLHTITFVWTKGHAGTIENERCDQLAVAASQQAVLLEDRREE